ncbi:amidohydrolase family protein [Vibrio sp. S11_S32]|uniref:amidohydrolase family protein n=1 Tax=Vibrio sp. S11_S32 TaxID=2720225 RepID=UPI0016812954|nr:amidohydrolase family protein [Vibrio sp. S11_S32]MBD1576795.1 amidohydrolase family protein [Vibrio sp. S11_S32]
MPKSFLLKNISYLDSNTMKLSKGDVRVIDGYIVSIDKCLNPCENEKIISSEDTIMLPGLVNAHLHPSKEIYGSTLDSSPIDVVLDSVHKNNELESSDGQYISSLKSLMSALKNGVTTFGVFTSRIESDVLAVRQIRCRCVINFCQNNTWIGSGKSPKNKPVEVIIQEYLEAENKYQQELITLSPATASELSADDTLLIRLHELAHIQNKKFTLHIHEGLHQVKSHKNEYHISGIERLDSLNILDKNTTLIHSCYLSDKDLELLKISGCNIIHCPVSNSFVGAGTLPLSSLLPDVTVGIGTDAAMVNPANDLIFDAFFSLYHHGDSDFSRKVDASTILSILTEGGAKSLGISNVGRIEVGFKADFIFFNINEIDTGYINTPISLLNMLKNEKPSQVIVNGETIINHGIFTNKFLNNNDLKFSKLRRMIIT